VTYKISNRKAHSNKTENSNKMKIEKCQSQISIMGIVVLKVKLSKLKISIKANWILFKKWYKIYKYKKNLNWQKTLKQNFGVKR